MFRRFRWVVALMLAWASTCLGAAAPPVPRASATGAHTYAALGERAESTLIDGWFVPGRGWKLCAQGCRAVNSDWGADGLTFVLFERWRATHDPKLVPYFADLERSAPQYGPPCGSVEGCRAWSDVPLWDSIAASREYAVTGDVSALAKARAAFAFVDASARGIYAFGACPQLDYQRPGGTQHLKTLETDSNYVKAALLLYGFTRDPAYLAKAVAKYAAIRERFLDPALPLYTVYVFDSGTSCVQAPHRFFAGVNGNMITAGLLLSAATKNRSYAAQAMATARAVATRLADPRGIFADLAAENDIAEPLVESMFDLATEARATFAARWLRRNASAAAGTVGPDGSYGRFFDGPAPQAQNSAFATDGGFAVAVAAAAVAGKAALLEPRDWTTARFVPRALTTGDAVTFSGRQIAFTGTLGDRCCEPGHARVFVDGAETVDGTGIWQNKSSTGLRIAHSVLFAWCWNVPGKHTIAFVKGEDNEKEGPSYLNLDGYLVR